MMCCVEIAHHKGTSRDMKVRDILRKKVLNGTAKEEEKKLGIERYLYCPKSQNISCVRRPCLT